MSNDLSGLEAQLRAYGASLDAATEAAAAASAVTTAPTTLHPRRPFRAALLAAAAVIVAVAIAVGAAGLSHRSSAPPAGPATTTSTSTTGTSATVVAVPRVAVPNVVGEQLTPALAQLASHHLKGITKKTTCTTSPVGTVVAQLPAAGTSVERRATVTLTLCTSHPAPLHQTLSVAVCTTVHGALGGSQTAPKTVTIATPPFTSPQLAGYSDDRGQLPITGPAGWGCRAVDAGDGGTGVEVTPPGVHPTSSCCTDAMSTKAISDGIFAGWDPACQGCVYDEICGIVPSADADFPSFASSNLCSPAPAGRRVTPLGNNVYLVEDVAGALGPDAARTILKYTPKTATTDASAVREACILPPAQQTVCAALETQFLDLR